MSCLAFFWDCIPTTDDSLTKKKEQMSWDFISQVCWLCLSEFPVRFFLHTLKFTIVLVKCRGNEKFLVDILTNLAQKDTTSLGLMFQSADLRWNSWPENVRLPWLFQSKWSECLWTPTSNSSFVLPRNPIPLARMRWQGLSAGVLNHRNAVCDGKKKFPTDDDTQKSAKPSASSAKNSRFPPKSQSHLSILNEKNHHDRQNFFH